MRSFILALVVLSLPGAVRAQSKDGNRLAYLDEVNPYYPSRTFPKLITPQWVGEPGVEAVVILGIDDMREPKRYEAFLRPILRRLQKIDGRAPVSIMTNQVNPNDPQLQTWLKEGLSIECHTLDHPCPFFAKGSFAKGKETYDKCVDLMARIPNSWPVAFRMPCCDSLNTPSPRFYAEIFNKTTAKGNFLTIDTSVFNIFTANDPELPRELVLLPDGSERFRRYIPKDRSFVNTIEDYPYPYVIGRLCWQFPCVTPSDWQANHFHKPNNPQTVRDWKAALDCTVIKQGVMCLVFHPHGWCRNDQIVELIDYAAAKHGKKVKFLNFREAQERLNQNLLAGHRIRHPKNGQDNGIRVLDLNDDGHLDAIVSNKNSLQTKFWLPEKKSWQNGDFPLQLSRSVNKDRLCIVFEPRFGLWKSREVFSMMVANLFWHFENKSWVLDKGFSKGLEINEVRAFTTSELGGDAGVRLLDLDGDGKCEALWQIGDNDVAVFAWSQMKQIWSRLPFNLPPGASITDGFNHERGLRFLDLDGDGKLDIIFSNEKEYGIYLFKDMKTGWSRKVMAGKRGDKDALPMIARNGTNNGFWVHSGHLWWSNEDTAHLKDHVDRRSINELLKNVEPEALSPEASLKSMKPRPGFAIELMAAEPLVADPIAFAWGPDGKLWVVEMGDYPLGVDGKGKHGGRIKFLEKAIGGRKPGERRGVSPTCTSGGSNPAGKDGGRRSSLRTQSDTSGLRPDARPNDDDGPYTKATVFLDNLGYPTGVMPWGKGVIVTCAPEIFYAEDTDGDGKADKKVVLYTGFAEGNQQHRVNGLVWGLDNWIYGANGDSGGNVKSIKTGQMVNISGRDFRIKPDQGLIEAATGQTQFGRSRDDWGNWFGCNNSNPMFHFVLEDHYLRRNPHLPAPAARLDVSVKPGASLVFPISRTLPRFNSPDAVNHFTSACSAIVYRDDLFGPAYANNTFVSEPVHNLIHREIMTPKGVTFTSRRAPDEENSEFLASKDNWFRPTMIQTGPDGALWVADMYRHVIEHPEWIPRDWQKKLDLRAGHDKGRIYRIYPVGKKPREIPRLDKMDIPELVAALDGPSGWQRDMAQQMLLHNPFSRIAVIERVAIQRLKNMAKQNNRPVARLHALCTLDGLKALRPELLQHALKDPHSGVRRHAVRLCEPWIGQSPALQSALLECLADDDPLVRMQLAYSLGSWDAACSGEALAPLAARDHGDPYLLSAIMSSANKKNLGAMMKELMKSGKEPPPAAVLEKLLILANAFDYREGLATLLAAVAMPQNGRYTGSQFSTLASLLDALDRQNTSLARLGQQGNDEMKKSLNGLSGLYAAARKLTAEIRPGKAPSGDQLLAIPLMARGLDRHAEDLQALAKLLSPQMGDDVQSTVVNSLGRLKDKAIPEILLANWKSHAPVLRNQVLDVLLSRPEWTRTALDALQTKKILPMEIDAARRQRLTEHRQPDIRKRAATLLVESFDPDRRKVVAAYLTQVKEPGDPALGAKVFTKTCAACHQLGGLGQQVGPDLASVPDKSTAGMLNAILDPNQAVESRYVGYTAVTRNGLTLNGLLSSETSTSITLVSADGKKHVILRSELEELFSTGKSTMPEGLEKDITPSEMSDLLAFIRKNVPPAKRREFPGNRPEVIQPAKDGTLHLKASN